MATSPLDAFLVAALVPRDRSHAAGALDEAEAILAAHPSLPAGSIHAAAALGDAPGVQRLLRLDRALATAPAGPWGWDPLTCLCFSRYLRLDPARSDGFEAAAAALLEAGADPNTGWYEEEHEPRGTWESVLYGAAGIAHHPGLTRLLLAHGADPNDDEVVYHAPEGRDNRALQLLLDTGRLRAHSLAVILVRKCDWHDEAGVRLALAHGADPNHRTGWGMTPVFHAIRRDNDAAIVEALLEHGGDPAIVSQGLSAIALAARRGRGDLLARFAARGVTADLSGVDRLIAACAVGDAAALATLAQDRALLGTLRALGGALIAEFAGVGNAAGVGHLLDLGVPVDARYAGDGYFAIASGSTALHVAAWRARHDIVGLLLSRGADPNATDGEGRTPLALAVRAGVDSYWMERRRPDSVRLLLEAGAAPVGLTIPTGWPDVDRLLR